MELLPTVEWVVSGVLFSYIISCTSDFGPFRKEWENLPKAILNAWYAAIISLVSRMIFIFLTLLMLQKIFIMVYPNVSGNLNSFMFGGSICFCSAFIITLPPQKISKLLKKQARNELHLAWWIKLLIKSENLSWGKIISMLEFIRAEQTNEIWMEKDNRMATFILFEEKKDVLIRYHFRNMNGLGEKLWLYLGLLGGNNNSKRAEALIHVFGTKWLKREIAVLREGRRISSIPVKDDQRKFKSSWLKKPPIADLEKGKRKCDHLLLEILNNLWKN